MKVEAALRNAGELLERLVSLEGVIVIGGSASYVADPADESARVAIMDPMLQPALEAHRVEAWVGAPWGYKGNGFIEGWLARGPDGALELRNVRRLRIDQRGHVDEVDLGRSP